MHFDEHIYVYFSQGELIQPAIRIVNAQLA